MKILIFTLTLTLFIVQESPVGVWLYIQDSSKIEIYIKDSVLSGTLISSKNISNEPGLEIFKNFKYKNGKWRGKLYLNKAQHWVDASLQPKGNLLLIEYKYGFIEKRFHLFKENQHK
ncbi:MAG: hypothetical protein ACQEQB_05980 [Bacteroidota bacterium]